jgi:hypothetical protein
MITEQDIDTCSKNAFNHVENVCKKFGPRYSGSKEEKAAAEDLEKQLKEYSDDTVLEKFDVFPDLYPQGLIKLTIYCALFFSIFTIFTVPYNLIAIFGGLFAFFILFVSLVQMKEYFGFLFDKKISQNVIGKIYPRDKNGEKIKGKIKIIMAGHLDSANQMKIVSLGDNIAKITLGRFWLDNFTLLLGLLKTFIVPFVSSVILYQNPVITISYFDIIWFIVSIPGIPFNNISKNGIYWG